MIQLLAYIIYSILTVLAMIMAILLVVINTHSEAAIPPKVTS